ncbi:membrane integrity-associated transporter subunit PqiC [Paraburkholderia sp. LEh10]|uniref:PqiC family protein n=1 Tax=Paraburkholderia sp. LEh10 TaxID=2821353 RepID=UPI001AE65586|nr:PqiC family protein [Paraburkholderia sp. LEh10]MBP0590297.1 membrane integrity-associated transporter subunit PqiC [Paraburkholderia sp. LEh10]
MTRRCTHSARLAAAFAAAAVRSAALVVSLAGTALTGCGNSMPVRYVTLNALPANAPRATAPIQPVQLTAVHMPAVLDRPEVVTLASQNRLTIHENDRWGAPLAQLARRTLAQDLLTRLPPGSFVFPDAPAPPDTRTLVVTVLDSESDAGGTLTLQAAWTLLSGHPASVMLTREATLKSQATGHDAEAQAAAMSRVLGELADGIAASIVVH